MNMNTEKVQQEIEAIIANIRSKGWRMNKPTQKALRRLEELGLAEYMGPLARTDIKCDAIVNAVISAADDAGGKVVTESGWTIDGDGYASENTTQPSALYLAMHEAPEETATEEAMDKAQKIEILDALAARENCQNQHLDHLNFTFESEISYDPNGKPDCSGAARAVSAEKRLAKLGEDYFTQGFRLKRTGRYTQGLPYERLIPDDAIIFRRVSSGYLAAAAQERIEYVIKKQ
jgi:hypothetical protein